jgi:lipopolysaccharide transport system permease protein
MRVATRTTPALIYEAADNRLRRSPYGNLHHALRYWPFFAAWVRRGLVTRYRQTSLGLLWALIQPLLTSLVYVLVFAYVLRIRTGRTPYVVFIVLNVVLWTYFTRIVLSGSASVIHNMDLIGRARFPREFLPLAVAVESMVDLAIGLAVTLPIFLYYRVPLRPSVVFAGGAFLIETILAVGLALMLAGLTVLVRDLTHILPISVQLLLYLSPVLYPLTIVPIMFQGAFLANPIGAVFASYNESIFLGQFDLAGPLLIAAAVSVVILVLSYRLFKRLEWRFADLL